MKKIVLLDNGSLYIHFNDIFQRADYILKPIQKDSLQYDLILSDEKNLKKQLVHLADLPQVDAVLLDMGLEVFPESLSKNVFFLIAFLIKAQNESIPVVPYIREQIYDRDSFELVRMTIKEICNKEIVVLPLPTEHIDPLFESIEVCIYDPAE